MDITMIRKKITSCIKKYRFVAVVLVIGVVLMLIPTGRSDHEETTSVETLQQRMQLEITAEQLEVLLSQIDGAGDVEVLLTFAAGQRTDYITNGRSTSTENSTTHEYETVLVSGDDRTETALIAQVFAPEYLGAVVVCQGAENPSVKLAISEAVSKATGLGMDRISILKMN